MTAAHFRRFFQKVLPEHLGHAPAELGEHAAKLKVDGYVKRWGSGRQMSLLGWGSKEKNP